MDPFIGVLNTLQREARIPKIFSITLFDLDCLRLYTRCPSDKFPGYDLISHAFKGKISSPTKNYGTWSKEQPLTVFDGGKLIALDSNCFRSLEFFKTLMSLLLPYFPISVRVKQCLALQTASRTNLKNPL